MKKKLILLKKLINNKNKINITLYYLKTNKKNCSF